jgi:hypothetical protein
MIRKKPVPHLMRGGHRFSDKIMRQNKMGHLRRSDAMIALPSRFSFLVAAACLVGVAPARAAETPDTENGRYTLQPSGDGMLRLDTRTGTVSNCSNSASGWACYAVPDERAALDTEIGRLQAENAKLKEQLASREQAPAPGKIEDALPKSDKAPGTADGQRKIEIPLPSDQDMDRVMSFLERAWRRLIDMASRVQKDAAGKL